MAKVLYKPHTWIANEHITTDDLNNIENGIIDIYAIDSDLEKMDNKVTTGILTEDNTHTQYPSMKVVWDSFQKIGEDNLTQYTGLSSQSEYLMNIQCYYDDKVTIKNLNDIYLVDENNNLTNKKVSLSELIDINLSNPLTLFNINALSMHYTMNCFFKYIEPNNGKIISNTNHYTDWDLCARPPRKMEFVSLNENDTIYQNGDTLNINEIRDNLIFYAQDGYEWTYEQEGQTKKYADFLNDSDFSFENGEQSIQLQMTNDNALSESQELTINCNKTYGPSDFLQTINFSINVPIIINRTQIDSIRLFNPPTRRIYLKGKDTSVNYTGLQVQLIDENHNVWNSNNYPNGIIPLNELNITNLNISSLEQEEDTEIYYGYDITWTSPSLVDENNTPITMNISVDNDNQDYRLMVSTYHAKTMEIDTTNATTEYNSDDTISKTGLNIVIKDSRGQPYIGLTNGKPNSIDILINPTVATASDNIDYGESEEQYITISWKDLYNNNNEIKDTNSFKITVKKPYPKWSTCSDEELIEIISKIQQGTLTFEQIGWETSFSTSRRFYFSKSIQNTKYMPTTTDSIRGYLYIPENSSYTATSGDIHGFIVFYSDESMNNVEQSAAWANSNIRTFLNNTFLNAFNSNLKNLFKTIKVSSSKYITTNTVDTTTNKINLFSIFDFNPNFETYTDTTPDEAPHYKLRNRNSINKEQASIQYKIPFAIFNNRFITRTVFYEEDGGYNINPESYTVYKRWAYVKKYSSTSYTYNVPDEDDALYGYLLCFAAF